MEMSHLQDHTLEVNIDNPDHEASLYSPNQNISMTVDNDSNTNNYIPSTVDHEIPRSNIIPQEAIDFIIKVRKQKEDSVYLQEINQIKSVSSVDNLHELEVYHLANGIVPHRTEVQRPGEQPLPSADGEELSKHCVNLHDQISNAYEGHTIEYSNEGYDSQNKRELIAHNQNPYRKRTQELTKRYKEEQEKITATSSTLDISEEIETTSLTSLLSQFQDTEHYLDNGYQILVPIFTLGINNESYPQYESQYETISSNSPANDNRGVSVPSNTCTQMNNADLCNGLILNRTPETDGLNTILTTSLPVSDIHVDRVMVDADNDGVMDLTIPKPAEMCTEGEIDWKKEFYELQQKYSDLEYRLMEQQQQNNVLYNKVQMCEDEIQNLQQAKLYHKEHLHQSNVREYFELNNNYKLLSVQDKTTPATDIETEIKHSSVYQSHTRNHSLIITEQMRIDQTDSTSNECIFNVEITEKEKTGTNGINVPKYNDNTHNKPWEKFCGSLGNLDENEIVAKRVKLDRYSISDRSAVDNKSVVKSSRNDQEKTTNGRGDSKKFFIITDDASSNPKPQLGFDELVKGSGVYIKRSELTTCEFKAGKSSSLLIRLLLELFFNTEVLANSSAAGRGHAKRPPLNTQITTAIIAFIKEKHPEEPDNKLLQAINQKCTDSRKSLRKRSINF